MIVKITGDLNDGDKIRNQVSQYKILSSTVEPNVQYTESR